MKKLSIIAASLLASTLYAGQALATNAIIWDFSTSGNVNFTDNDGLHQYAIVQDTSGNNWKVEVSALHVVLPYLGQPNNPIVNDSLFEFPLSTQNLGLNNSADGIGVHSIGNSQGTIGTVWDGETFADPESSQMNQQLRSAIPLPNTPVIEVLRLGSVDI
ncbi:MAG: hypothetical protein KBF71_08590 [Alphaproteobacteria bacterium]|nr:hypothetical protein [Alphaproteobacteria bacterium]